MSRKADFINSIIGIEGDYVDDPHDSGGETRWGITKRVARAHGYFGLMSELPRPLAFQIIEAEYWGALSLDDVESLSSEIAMELAESGVNCGIGRPAEWLQRSLNVLNRQQQDFADIAVDGDIGPATIAAMRGYMAKRGHDGVIVLLRMLNSLQGAHYITLAERREKDEAFIFGWFSKRID